VNHKKSKLKKFEFRADILSTLSERIKL
jgi:hypothetical protein